jgi:hypothetical protein
MNRRTRRSRQPPPGFWSGDGCGAVTAFLVFMAAVSELGCYASRPRSTMKPILFSILLCAAVALSGCIQHSRVEQRVVELPSGNTNATLATAAQIGQALVAGGLGADVQKQFPSLTQQQLQGVYLTWNAGVFSGTNSVFFLTGVRYTGSMPQAKAVADYLESRVKQAVATNFPPAASK